MLLQGQPILRPSRTIAAEMGVLQKHVEAKRSIITSMTLTLVVLRVRPFLCSNALKENKKFYWRESSMSSSLGHWDYAFDCSTISCKHVRDQGIHLVKGRSHRLTAGDADLTDR